MSFATRLVAFGSSKLYAKYFYPISTYLSGDGFLFRNWGYEEDPPMALPLSAADESNRFAIQLYHRTATQADPSGNPLLGKHVLEVSCGHGGGASYLRRTMDPASYTGLDLNRAGIDLCRKMHSLPGLNFVVGDAENLPFPGHSFDAVINIEASHLYPRLPRFLAELARVLRPGGHFLYADIRTRDRIAQWEEELGDAPMRLMSERDISEQVARGLEKTALRLKELHPHTSAYRGNRLLWRALQNGELSYRMYCFANE